MELAIRNPVTWMVYCAIYVAAFAGIAAFLWLNLEQRQPENLIDLLAKVSGESIALFAALSWEIIRSMVLLAPMLRKKFFNEGIEVGRKEGLNQGTEQERQRWEAWLQRCNEAEANNLPFNEPPPSEVR